MIIIGGKLNSLAALIILLHESGHISNAHAQGDQFKPVRGHTILKEGRQMRWQDAADVLQDEIEASAWARSQLLPIFSDGSSILSIGNADTIINHGLDDRRRAIQKRVVNNGII